MKKEQSQQDLLRAARKRLKVNNAELARMLGKSRPTLYSWLAKDTAPMKRTMPESSRLLLARLLADAKRRK
jgi:predicted DNA-binding transcriptional regulator AlpA